MTLFCGSGKIFCEQMRVKLLCLVSIDMLDTVMLPYAEGEMPFVWVFQQDNDLKHTSKKAKEQFERNSVNFLVWPAQSPELNPIDNL